MFMILFVLQRGGGGSCGTQLEHVFRSFKLYRNRPRSGRFRRGQRDGSENHGVVEEAGMRFPVACSIGAKFLIVLRSLSNAMAD